MGGTSCARIQGQSDAGLGCEAFVGSSGKPMPRPPNGPGLNVLEPVRAARGPCAKSTGSLHGSRPILSLKAECVALKRQLMMQVQDTDELRTHLHEAEEQVAEFMDCLDEAEEGRRA